MEVIIAIVLIILTIVFFVLRKDTKEKETPQTPTKQVEMQQKKQEIETPTTKILNNKDYMINSFRKDRDLKNAYIYENGKYFLFYNEKSVFFGIFNNLTEKEPRIMSKNVEHDVICDACYSVEKK